MPNKKIISLEEEFTGLLLGIVTQLRDYQLCWQINRLLNFRLYRMNDFELINRRKNKTSVFSYYKFNNELDKWTAYVISNKHLGEFLVPEVKEADFFLMVKGEIETHQKNDWMAELRKLPLVRFVTELDYSRLKSRSNLVLE